MSESNTFQPSSKTRNSNFFREGIGRFINIIYNKCISRAKKVCGTALDKIHFSSWKERIYRELIDLAFTSIIITFILMAFTEGVSPWLSAIRGTALALVMTVVLGFTRRMKEVLS